MFAIEDLGRPSRRASSASPTGSLDSASSPSTAAARVTAGAGERVTAPAPENTICTLSACSRSEAAVNAAAASANG